MTTPAATSTVKSRRIEVAVYTNQLKPDVPGEFLREGAAFVTVRTGVESQHEEEKRCLAERPSELARSNLTRVSLGIHPLCACKKSPPAGERAQMANHEESSSSEEYEDCENGDKRHYSS